MSGFVVLPALVTDISAVYDVYFAAFKDNFVTRALFPAATSEDMMNPASEFRKAHTLHTQEYGTTDPTQYTLKCVDLETGKIVGMALWDVYLTPSTWKRPEIGWLSGEERERAESIISPLWDARENFWLDQRYLYCHVVAVHPEHQRQGVGQLLMKFGIDVAQKARLPIYIESSQDGVRLYEKLGCRRLKQPSNGRNGKTLPAEDDPKQGGEAVLFVWVPRGGELSLPTNVREAQI